MNQRIDNQQARTQAGLANGTITGKQAARDESHDANIAQRPSAPAPTKPGTTATSPRPKPIASTTLIIAAAATSPASAATDRTGAAGRHAPQKPRNAGALAVTTPFQRSA